MIAILAVSRILSGVTRWHDRNRSALHWDLIRDLRQGGRMTVNGRVFHMVFTFGGHFEGGT